MARFKFCLKVLVLILWLAFCVVMTIIFSQPENVK